MVNIKSKPILVLTIEVETDDWDEIKRQLDENFKKKFFTSNGGMPFVVQPRDGVSEETVRRVIDYLIQKGLKPLLYPQKGEKKNGIPTLKASDIEKIKGATVKVINKNVRAGQLIEHRGDVIVIGDVNPGAEIRAGGNIVILGALKGVAWAGYPGNTEAVVVAMKMEPQQLRIGNIIGTTEGVDFGEEKPEIAKVVDGEIVLEPLI